MNVVQRMPGFGYGLGPMGGMQGWTLIYLAMVRLRAQQQIDRRWASLVEEYPDAVETLEVAFGKHLRQRYPDVRSQHAPKRLQFGDPSGRRLTVQVGEPDRTPHGWGGARLQAWRGDVEVRLPVGDLFLTFARGFHPEWVAWIGGIWPLHRAAIVDDAFVADTARLAFDAP